MDIMHEILMRATESMPMKQIDINGEPYLQRYFISRYDDGVQYWLHRFLRNDAERHMHTHPWSAYSKIITGTYTERTAAGDRIYSAGEVNYITPDKAHRIVQVKPNTWTLMTVQPGRKPDWKFIGEDGEQIVSASPVEWWKGCKCRGEK